MIVAQQDDDVADEGAASIAVDDVPAADHSNSGDHKVKTKEVVTAASATITAATSLITAATLTATPSATRRRKGVLIRDPKETATPSIIIHS
nr:hypothetical protein [Tanacetum cinerariifolium]